jgi:transcriptional regulator with XRE-family HTH domain
MDASDTLRAEPSLEAVGATPRAYFRALGRRIAMLRKQHEMSQIDLSLVLCTSQQTITAYENGGRRLQIHQIPTLMRTFQVSAESLLGLQPLPPPTKVEISPSMLRLVENLDKLSTDERRVVSRMVEAMARD